MTRMITVGRRRFLTMTGLALAAVGFGRLGYLVMPEYESTLAKSFGQHIAGLLHCQESARVVGRAYLQHRPQEADIRLLLHSVTGDRGNTDARKFMTDQAALYNVVRAGCRRDFGKGELVAIGGWYLTRSEARLCALVEMLHTV